MALRYTFRSEKKQHKFVFGKRLTTVRELKEYILNNHKGVNNVAIIEILSDKELDDSTLLQRGGNVQVKRVASQLQVVTVNPSILPISLVPSVTTNSLAQRAEQAHLKRQYLNLQVKKRTIKRMKREREEVVHPVPHKKSRGIPLRFLNLGRKRDDSHLREQCDGPYLTSKGDAALLL